MKKKLYIFIFILSIFSIHLFAGSKYFYYGPEGKIALQLSRDKILVRFSDNSALPQRMAILSSDKIASTTSKAILPALKSTIVRLRTNLSESDVENLIRELNTDDQVIYATPFFIYSDGTVQGLQNKFMVRLTNPADFYLLQEKADYYHVSVDGQDAFDPNLFHLSTTKFSLGNAMDIANLFYESGLFELAEPDFIQIRAAASPNDTYLDNQWNLSNNGTNTSTWGGTAGCDLNIFNAWTISTGSSSIKIALIDNGVELTHPDLANNLLPGYDATGLGSQGGPDPDNGHGTSCAGIAAAVANNSKGIAGIAYGCKIVPIRFEYKLPDSSGLITTNSWTANAINYAWQTAHADVLSNSWSGGAPSSVVTNAINNAVIKGRTNKGSAVVFAAGNTNSAVDYPAYLSNVICVTAMSMCNERKNPGSCDGEAWWGGNYGDNLDVAAPGVKIFTTDLTGPGGFSSNDYTPFFDGTSSATPAVAAVVALIYSVNPNLTLTEARYILESTCQKVGNYSYNANVPGQPNGTWSSELGYGRVDAYAALLAAQVPSCVESYEPNNTKNTAAPVTANSSITSQISSAGDMDWFSFSNTSSQNNIKLMLTNLPAAYNLQLWDPDGAKVATGANAGGGNRQIIFNTTKTGTYKIKVFGVNNVFNSTQCYTLSVSISGTPFRHAEPVSAIDISASVFPNPATGTATIAYHDASATEIEISILDIRGDILYFAHEEANAGMNIYPLDVQDFKPGIYLLQIRNGSEVTVSKFLVNP